MMDGKDLLLGYLIYNEFFKDKSDRREKRDCEDYDNYDEDVEYRDEIEDIMDEYGVDEDEAEEIYDSM